MEQLLAQHGGDLAMAGRLPSFALGPEIHAEAGATAGGGPGVAPGSRAPSGSHFQPVLPQQQQQQQQQQVAARPSSGGGMMPRRNSGLESMQSMEHALVDTQRRAAAAAAANGAGCMHEAMDAAVRAVQRTLTGTKRK